MKKLIQSQGELDSACYLYSIVNGYLALTKYTACKNNKSMEVLYKKWDSVISNAPFANDFFIGGPKGGTYRYNYSEQLYEVSAVNALKALKEKGEVFECKVSSEITNLRDLKEHLDSNTVAVICPGDEHWITAVAYDNGVKAACSWQLNTLVSSYKEFPTHYGRYFNSSIRSGEIDFALLITRIA